EISAASIIAKVYRDNLMHNIALNYPKYFFEKHKGYLTKIHQEAIDQFGATSLHRKSFKPFS
ncbi:MAG: ribonuclease HII, partial [Methylophilaceae bacterium]